MPLLSDTIRGRIARFDADVDGFFDRLRGDPCVDRVFYTASALGDFSLLWMLLAAARGLRSDRDTKAAVRAFALLGAESFIVNVGIKSLFGRTRPAREAHHSLRLRRPRSSSFPSGHATSAFCAAVLLGEDDPLWPVYVALAAIVAASRIHTKIHHASDVAGGIPLGLAFGLLGRRLVPLDGKPLGIRR